MKLNESLFSPCFSICFDHTVPWHIHRQLFNSSRSEPSLIGATRNKSKQETELVSNRAHNALKPLMFLATVQWVYILPRVPFFLSQCCFSWGVAVERGAVARHYTAVLWGTCAALLVLILILFNSLCLTPNSMQAPRLESFQTILSSPKLGIGFPWNISLLPLGTLPIWPNLFHHWF